MRPEAGNLIRYQCPVDFDEKRLRIMSVERKIIFEPIRRVLSINIAANAFTKDEHPLIMRRHITFVSNVKARVCPLGAVAFHHCDWGRVNPLF